MPTTTFTKDQIKQVQTLYTKMHLWTSLCENNQLQTQQNFQTTYQQYQIAQLPVVEKILTTQEAMPKGLLSGAEREKVKKEMATAKAEFDKLIASLKKIDQQHLNE